MHTPRVHCFGLHGLLDLVNDTGIGSATQLASPQPLLLLLLLLVVVLLRLMMLVMLLMLKILLLRLVLHQIPLHVLLLRRSRLERRVRVHSAASADTDPRRIPPLLLFIAADSNLPKP